MWHDGIRGTGRVGGRGGGHGRGGRSPFAGPNIPSVLHRELEESGGVGIASSGFGGGRGGRGRDRGRGKSQIFDRKSRRAAAKEEEKEKRRRQAEWRAKRGKRGCNEPLDTAQSNPVHASQPPDASAAQPSKRRKPNVDAEDETRTKRITQTHQNVFASNNKKGNAAASLAAAKKRKLPLELRMGHAVLDAYHAEEAAAKRIEKKLKGRKGPDDGLGDLLKGLPGLEFLQSDDEEEDEEEKVELLKSKATRIAVVRVVEEVEDDDDEEKEEEEEQMDDTKQPVEAVGRYIPPAQRAAAAAAAAAAAKIKSKPKDAAPPGFDAAVRQIRGLMNRLGEANVPSIVSDVADLATRFPRRAVADAASEEILKALIDGPRASEQYAAALAAFVAG